MRFHEFNEFNSIWIWFPDLFKSILAMSPQFPACALGMPNWLRTVSISFWPPTNTIDVFKMKQKTWQEHVLGILYIRYEGSPLAGIQCHVMSTAVLGTLTVVAFHHQARISVAAFWLWAPEPKNGTSSDSTPSPETSYFSKSSCKRFFASSSK